MGIILTLRRYYYAETNEDRNEALSILRKLDDTKSVSELVGIFRPLYTEEILRCVVHGKSNDEREKDEKWVSKASHQTQREDLQKMRDEIKIEYPPYRPGLEKQCSCQFDDIVRELSSPIALAEWENNAKTGCETLLHLWRKSKGKRFLFEPLQALCEIWGSLTDKEVGSFRQHYYKRDDNRVERLKGLGNAIVPQVAFQIMQAIKETERTAPTS